MIPAYNCADVIADTIKSIRHSGLEDYEIIVVNDGSTDRTAQVLDHLLKQEPALIVLAQSNSGVSAARNYAISKARGEYLVFLDADDAMVENAYGAACSQIQKHRPDMLLFGTR